jgi:hypothetical protein
MANVRLTMRKIREVLRLHFECDRNQREIADAVGTRQRRWHYLRRTRLAGWLMPPPPELLTDDAALEARLYPPPRGASQRAACRTGRLSTARSAGKASRLDLLWQEYKAQHPTAAATAGSARLTRNGRSGFRSRCGKRTCRARSCSSTTAARSWASSTRTPVKSARPSVRRCARRVRAYVCGAHLDPAASRLDRLARARLRVL